MASKFEFIEGWPDYAVNKAGRVISRKRRWLGWLTLKPGLASNGYLTVCLSRQINGKTQRKTFCLHELVLCAFVGPMPESAECCRHLDGNKLNNELENLKWGTFAENSHDMDQHGTRALGEKHGGKLTKEKVLSIRRRHASGITQTKLAKEHGVHQVTISEIVTRKIWRHI